MPEVRAWSASGLNCDLFRSWCAAAKIVAVHAALMRGPVAFQGRKFDGRALVTWPASCSHP
eukprot:2269111-Lingulodinium_polyedra.AAC.1